MANSRLEKLGTIFTRVTSLMKCGAMSPNDKPLWYDVYQRFPPIDEPSFARRVHIREVKPILYPEDRIRAKFHRGNYVRTLKIESLGGGATTSDITQKVISLTADIMKQEPNLKEDDAIQKAVSKLVAEDESESEKPRSMFKPQHRKTANLTTSVDMVKFPQQVDSSTLKNIAQKDVDVTSNLVDQEEEIVEKSSFTRSSILKDFQKASKSVADKKMSTDDSPEEK